MPTSTLEINVHNGVFYLKEAPTSVSYAAINDTLLKWFVGIKKMLKLGNDPQIMPDLLKILILLNSLDTKLSNFHILILHQIIILREISQLE